MRYTKHAREKEFTPKLFHSINLQSLVPENNFSTIKRRGRTAAVSTTARKLAVIIWNMISKKLPYTPPTEYLFVDQKRKIRLVGRIRKNIAKLELKPADVGFITE